MMATPTGLRATVEDTAAEPAPVVETAVNVPVFVDGLHLAEVDRHGLARLIFTAEQRDASSGILARVVVARLTLPTAVMAEVAGRMLAAAARTAAVATAPPAPHQGRPLN